MNHFFKHLPHRKAVIDRVFHTVMPPRCVCCDVLVGDAQGLCAPCWQDFPSIDWPYCDVLGVPFEYDRGEDTLSKRAMADPPLFNRARAAALYDGPARRLVAQLKFYDRLDVAEFMGRLMVRACHDYLGDIDVLVPVPLHRLRLFGRRFNQSAELCRVIAAILAAEGKGVRAEMLALEKTRRTPPQVGLDREDRQRNVANTFRVKEGMRASLFGARVLLVDDVMTTGATANACAKVLLDAGARSVDVVTFATVAGVKSR